MPDQIFRNTTPVSDMANPVFYDSEERCKQQYGTEYSLIQLQ